MWITRYWLPIPLICVLIGVATSSGPLIGLGAFMLIAGLVAKKWSDYALARVTYERRIPENRAFAGERLKLTLRLINDKLLPVPWIEVRDLVPEAFSMEEEHLSPSTSPGQVYLTRSTHLSWYERVNWPIELDAPARGYYRLGPARLSASDIFGFFPTERDVESHDSIIIYPTVYTMPELGFPAERPFGEQKGRNRIFEDPSRISGVRDYQPEDSLRRIDWKASARRMALQSKVYEPSSTLHLLVAVNVHTLVHSWQGYVPETLEHILSVAGSVARYGFEAGYAVGLAANGAYPTSDRPMRIPVGRRPDQLMRILEALGVIGPLTLTPLHTVIHREAQAFPFGATLVCVTSLMDSALAATLLQVRRAGHSVIVLSLSGAPFEEDLGPVPVHDLSATMRALQSRTAEQRPGGPEQPGLARQIRDFAREK